MLKAEDFPDFCFVFYLGHDLLSLDQVRDEKKMRLQMIKKDPPELNFSMCERHNWNQSCFSCSRKPCSVATTPRKWKTSTSPGRRTLMSVTISSMYILPPLHQWDCFDVTAAI